MKSIYSKLALLSLLSVFTLTVQADDDKKSNCTDEAIAAAEAYDPGSSDLTTCISVREDFKVVVSWSSNAFNGKIFKTSGAKVGQQAVNVRNLARDYENNYGMKHGEDYKSVVVAYSKGVDWLRLTTDAENQTLINGLMAKGIKIYACQNTMKAKGLVISDLLPGVEIVPAGVSAVVDLQNKKYVSIHP